MIRSKNGDAHHNIPFVYSEYRMQIVIKISLYFLEMNDAENSTSWLLLRFILSLSFAVHVFKTTFLQIRIRDKTE